MNVKNINLILLFSFLFLNTGISQKWINVDNDSFRADSDERIAIPKNYSSYEIDFDHLSTLLESAPKRFTSNKAGIEVNWPMPDNSFQTFIIKRSDVFHPDLAAKYPAIQAYTGHSLSDPTAILKISISHKGAEGMLLSNRHETIYTDRWAPNSKNKYIVYNRSDYHRDIGPGEGRCTVEIPDEGVKEVDSSVRFGDCQLRKYRLALACTGEYATFHGGNKPDVLAEYNASLVRVNGIYERDLSITMELIANTDELIFLNGSTDPYTNNNGSAMLGQNQSTVNQIIGSANYDIGHVYSTGGGGIASLGSPCTGSKARGVTGLPNPTGDFFWVDYVAHEMGHQFGANHTFNNSCNNNRNNATAIEPGSGATIMAYAGICSPNVQNNSDDYFHSISQNEIANFVVAGAGSCAEIIMIDNNPPEIETITETGQILPIRTPFLLTATASDPDNDALTYCWEQVDNEIATMPPSSSSTGGPAFRSYDPTENSTRYFPGLPSLLTGINSSTWEVLPNSNRDMSFNLTVRDNHSLKGCTDDTDLDVIFTTEAGPFLITSQNTSTTWNAGETEMITWDVANTDQAPVSCANVDILFSLNRGQSFDIVLAENIPNDGEHEIVVPFQFSSQGRIMVKCASSIFFDFNNRDINIIAPFTSAASPKELSVCPGQQATFSIDYTVFGSDPLPVTFDLMGLPSPATFTFSPDQIEEDGEIILTIDNITGDIAGIYDLEIITASAALTQSETVELIVGADQNEAVTYFTPEEGQSGYSTSPLLSWQALNGIVCYEVQISDNPSFENVIFNTIATNTFTIGSGLMENTVYYWRVRGMSPCVEASWLNFQSFQTGGLFCSTETATPDLEISDSGEVSVESDIVLSSTGKLGGLEVSIHIDHTWVGDLSASLRTPLGQVIKLFDQPGVPASQFGCDEENLVVTFSTSATNTADDFENTCVNGDIAIEGTYQPLDPFSLIYNSPIDGTWTLIVDDITGPDGGTLIEWSLTTCEASPNPPGVILKNNILQLNNAVEGNITQTLLELENSDPLISTFTISSMPLFGNVQKWNETTSLFETIGLGSQFTQDDINQDRIKYVLTDLEATDDQFLFDTQDDLLRYTSNNTFLITSSIAALTISANITNQISCFGESDGRIDVMGLGGIPDYTYSINGGAFEEVNIFENLGEGDYTIIVKDDFGTEVSSQTLSIIQPAQITYVFFKGDNEITIGGEGGTGALIYSLDGTNYTTEATIPIMDGEAYQIFVKDENDCIAQSSEMVFYQIGGADISVVNVDCKGNSTGSLGVNVVGGLSPYTYQIDENTPINESNFTDLPAGMYSITVRDSDGNQFIVPDVVVSEPEFDLVIMSNVVEDMVSLGGNGGTEPYQYSIDGENYQDAGDYSELPNGDYTGYIVDANGCQDSVNFIIMVISTIDDDLEQLNLLPNPANVEFTFMSPTSLYFDYQIIDVTGKVIANDKGSSNTAIRVDHLPSGLYLVKVNYNNVSKVFKLSKI